MKSVWLLLLCLLVACGSRNDQVTPASAQLDESAPLSHGLALDWFDYVEPSYTFSKHPGVTTLYSKLNVSQASTILILGSCSGFFEFSILKTALPNASIDSVCAKAARLFWLKDKVKDLPSFRVFSYDEELADPKQYDLIVWYDFPAETPGFGYFSKLVASSLKAGGTFAFISAKPFPDLSTRMSFSPVALYQQFALEGPGFPLRQALSPALVGRVDQELAQPRLEFTQKTMNGIFAELNAQLDSPDLFKAINNFYNNKSGFASEVIAFVPWEYIVMMQYLYVLNSESIWGDTTPSASARGDIRTLNWVIITSLFSMSTFKGRGKDELPDTYGSPFIRGAFEALGLRPTLAIGDYEDVEVVTFTR